MALVEEGHMHLKAQLTAGHTPQLWAQQLGGHILQLRVQVEEVEGVEDIF